MPGLAGFYSITASSDISSRENIIKMVDQICIVGESCKDTYWSNRVGLGRHFRSTLNPEPQPVTDATGRYVAFFAGYIANSIELWKHIDPSILGDSDESDAALVLAHFLQCGENGLTALNGIFAAAVYDTSEEVLNLFTDRYGYRYIYYKWDGQKFVFSSDFDVVVDAGYSEGKLNLNGACDLFTYGFISGTQTLLKDIQMLPHGAYCRIDKKGFECRQYWEYPHNKQMMEGEIDELTENAAEIAIQASERLAAKFPRVAVPLSGGLDSRACAILFHGCAKEEVAFHVGAKGFHETEIARRIAKALNMPWKLFDQKEFDFPGIEKSCRELSDGTILWGGGLFVPMYEYINQHHPELCVVDGLCMDVHLGGDFVGAFPPVDYDYAQMGEEAFVSAMPRFNRTMGLFAAELFFASSFAERVKGRTLEAVSQCLADFPSGTAEERTRYFYFVNRGRRMAHVGHSLYDSFCGFLYPGLDYDLFDFFAQIPYRYLAEPKEGLYRKLITLLSPAVARIPWAVTNLPLDREVSRTTEKIRAWKNQVRYYVGRISHGLFDWAAPEHTWNYLFRHDKRFRSHVVSRLEAFAQGGSPLADERGVRELIRQQDSGRNYFLVIEYILTMQSFIERFVKTES